PTHVGCNVLAKRTGRNVSVLSSLAGRQSGGHGSPPAALPREPLSRRGHNRGPLVPLTSHRCIHPGENPIVPPDLRQLLRLHRTGRHELEPGRRGLGGHRDAKPENPAQEPQHAADHRSTSWTMIGEMNPAAPACPPPPCCRAISETSTPRPAPERVHEGPVLA